MSISLVAMFCGLSFAAQQSAQPVSQNTNSSQAAQSVAAATAPQAALTEQVQKGRALFATQCAFCHGRDAAGGETGPDLTSSELVEKDVNGNEIGPVVRSGRIDKGMPPFNLADADLAAIVAFIHEQKTKMESHAGRRRSVQPEDLQTGNAEEGKQYFNGAGGCAKCHSASGDLAGVATRFRGLALLERMLYPWGRRAGPSSSPVTATVTLPSGETVTGKLAYRDEFVIGLVDSSGWYHSWFKSNVKFKVNNPLEAHSEQLGKYTEEDMHNVLAYLQTLR
ncbi:MAG TPA: c-type cytochrome [Candidatus Acidoferrum sp.]|nr:c-type cytochrome [Candidatus Acidoferrum sp.]